MAKIGTAHVEIKPVINDEALNRITAAIASAVAAGVEAGMKAAQKSAVVQFGSVTVTNPHALAMRTPHDHAEYVDGCFRCDLSRDESGGRR